MHQADDWEQAVPGTITADPLWKMRVYRLALRLGDDGWSDVSRLIKDGRTASLSNQLYRALGSIGANLAEGYSRSSSRERAHFYEYALGSAREARDWYFKGRHVLGQEITTMRLAELAEIIRLLLTIIPAERGRALHDQDPVYHTGATADDGSVLEQGG